MLSVCTSVRSDVVVHLCEVDVLCGGEVEALLAAFMTQQTLREPVGHFHVAAVELLRVQRGVGQHRRHLLNAPRLEERGVTEKLFRLKKKINKSIFTRKEIPKTSVSNTEMRFKV